MCGIVGFVGQSKNPKITWLLANSLLEKTEIRGKEATGFWGAQADEDGQIIYHKEPVTSSTFVKLDIWKHVQNFNPSLLLAHCREPTTGAGIPKTNRNNHPHVSDSRTLAVVHNGRVEEYHQLKNKGYDKLRGECDSEIIRAIFEHGDQFGDDPELFGKKFPNLDRRLGNRLLGIDRIFSKLHGGAMAVAVGERLAGDHRALWLWRDEKRPLWVVDLRNCLGQIFFCSTGPIWQMAVEAVPAVKQFLPANHDLVEFPAFHTYLIEIDKNQPDTPKNPEAEGFERNGWESGWRLRRFKITREKKEGVEPELKPRDDAKPRQPVPVTVYTMLDDKEDVLQKPVIIYPGHEAIEVEDGDETMLENEDDHDLAMSGAAEDTLETTPAGDLPVIPNEPNVTVTVTNDGDNDDDETVQGRFDNMKLSDLSKRITDLVENISTSAYNLAIEGSITPKDFQAIIDDFEQVAGDLEGTKQASLNGMS